MANTQLGDLNSEHIPTVWVMRHWLSGHELKIANDGQLANLMRKFQAERDGYEVDSEMSVKDGSDDGQ